MGKTKKKSDTRSLAQALEADLLAQYGPMLTGEALRRALGYRSMDALRQAAIRGTVPVSLFRIKSRRGRFALSKDVARWLASQVNPASHEELQKDLETN